MNVLSSTSQNAWQEWDGAHTLRATPSGTSHPTCEKQYEINVFPFQHRRFVVHVAKRMAGMGRGAHSDSNPIRGSHPSCENTIRNQRFSFSTLTFCRPRRKMHGRNGTGRVRASNATGWPCMTTNPRRLAHGHEIEKWCRGRRRRRPAGRSSSSSLAAAAAA